VYVLASLLLVACAWLTPALAGPFLKLVTTRTSLCCEYTPTTMVSLLAFSFSDGGRMRTTTCTDDPFSAESPPPPPPPPFALILFESICEALRGVAM
jgi:hypothetical protein